MIVLPWMRRSGANAAGASERGIHGPDERLDPLSKVREPGTVGFHDEEHGPPVVGLDVYPHDDIVLTCVRVGQVRQGEATDTGGTVINGDGLHSTSLL
jgi:hypothetical protein